MIKFWTEKGNRNWLQTTGGVVAVSFLFSTLSAPFAEASIWQERKTAVEQMQKESKNREEQYTQVASASNFQTVIGNGMLMPKGVSPELLESLSKTMIPNLQHKSSIKSKDLQLPSMLVNKIEQYGEIERVYLAEGQRVNLDSENNRNKEFNLNTKLPLVIHIQDAHEIYSVQKNIAFLLKEFMGIGVNVVGVEGAEGVMQGIERWRKNPDKESLKEVGGYLLRKGMLSGVEAAGLGREKEQVEFYGVEKKEKYLDQVKSFKDTLGRNNEIKSWQDSNTLKISSLKTRIYSEDLKSLDRLKQKYEKGELKLGEWASALKEASIKAPREEDRDFSNVAKYLNAYHIEKEIDFKVVEKKQRELLEKLSQKLSQGELVELLQESLLYRLGNIGYGEFYSHLIERASLAGIELTPEIKRYIQYLLKVEGIDRERLFEELKDFSDKVFKEKINANPLMAEVYELDKDFSLMNKGLNFSLNVEEWQDYLKREKELTKIPEKVARLEEKNSQPEEQTQFQQVKEVLRNVEKFSRLSEERNGIFTHQLAERMKQKEEKISVLIAGGYHSAGIEESLKAKGISFITVRPRMDVSKVEKEYHPLNGFKRGLIPLEKMFMPEKVSLASLLASEYPDTAKGIGAEGALEQFTAVLSKLKGKKIAGSMEKIIHAEQVGEIYRAEISHNGKTIKVWTPIKSENKALNKKLLENPKETLTELKVLDGVDELEIGVAAEIGLEEGRVLVSGVKPANILARAAQFVKTIPQEYIKIAAAFVAAIPVALMMNGFYAPNGFTLTVPGVVLIAIIIALGFIGLALLEGKKPTIIEQAEKPAIFPGAEFRTSSFSSRPTTRFMSLLAAAMLALPLGGCPLPPQLLKAVGVQSVLDVQDFNEANLAELDITDVVRVGSFVKIKVESENTFVVDWKYSEPESQDEVAGVFLKLGKPNQGLDLQNQNITPFSLEIINGPGNPSMEIEDATPVNGGTGNKYFEKSVQGFEKGKMKAPKINFGHKDISQYAILTDRVDGMGISFNKRYTAAWENEGSFRVRINPKNKKVLINKPFSPSTTPDASASISPLIKVTKGGDPTAEPVAKELARIGRQTIINFNGHERNGRTTTLIDVKDILGGGFSLVFADAITNASNSYGVVAKPVFPANFVKEKDDYVRVELKRFGRVVYDENLLERLNEADFFTTLVENLPQYGPIDEITYVSNKPMGFELDANIKRPSPSPTASAASPSATPDASASISPLIKVTKGGDPTLDPVAKEIVVIGRQTIRNFNGPVRNGRPTTAIDVKDVLGGGFSLLFGDAITNASNSYGVVLKPVFPAGSVRGEDDFINMELKRFGVVVYRENILKRLNEPDYFTTLIENLSQYGPIDETTYFSNKPVLFELDANVIRPTPQPSPSPTATPSPTPSPMPTPNVPVIARVIPSNTISVLGAFFSNPIIRRISQGGQDFIRTTGTKFTLESGSEIDALKVQVLRGAARDSNGFGGTLWTFGVGEFSRATRANPLVVFPIKADGIQNIDIEIGKFGQRLFPIPDRLLVTQDGKVYGVEINLNNLPETADRDTFDTIGIFTKDMNAINNQGSYIVGSLGYSAGMAVAGLPNFSANSFLARAFPNYYQPLHAVRDFFAGFTGDLPAIAAPQTPFEDNPSSKKTGGDSKKTGQDGSMGIVPPMAFGSRPESEGERIQREFIEECLKILTDKLRPHQARLADLLFLRQRAIQLKTIEKVLPHLNSLIEVRASDPLIFSDLQTVQRKYTNYPAGDPKIAIDEQIQTIVDEINAIKAEDGSFHASLDILLAEKKSTNDPQRNREIDLQIRDILSAMSSQGSAAGPYTPLPESLNPVALYQNFLNSDHHRQSLQSVQDLLAQGKISFHLMFGGAATRYRLGTMYDKDLVKLAEDIVLKPDPSVSENFNDYITSLARERKQGPTIMRNRLLGAITEAYSRFRAQRSFQKVHFKKLSLAQRQLWQYRYQLEKIHVARGIPKDEVRNMVFSLPLVLYIAEKEEEDLDESSWDKVKKDFLKNNFYGFDPSKIYFIKQRYYPFYEYVNGEVFQRSNKEKVPFGHGSATLSLYYAKDWAVQIDAAGNEKIVEQSVYEELNSQGVDMAVYHRLNDLTMLTGGAIDLDWLSFAQHQLYGMGENNHNFVAELVANPNRQKGGNAVFNTATNRPMLIETVNSNGSPLLNTLIESLRVTRAPYNKFSLAMSMGRVQPILQGPPPLLRANVRYRNGFFSVDIVTGDISQHPESKPLFFQKSEDSHIHDFKEFKDLPEALKFITEQESNPEFIELLNDKLRIANLIDSISFTQKEFEMVKRALDEIVELLGRYPASSPKEDINLYSSYIQLIHGVQKYDMALMQKLVTIHERVLSLVWPGEEKTKLKNLYVGQGDGQYRKVLEFWQSAIRSVKIQDNPPDDLNWGNVAKIVVGFILLPYLLRGSYDPNNALESTFSASVKYISQFMGYTGTQSSQLAPDLLTVPAGFGAIILPVLILVLIFFVVISALIFVSRHRNGTSLDDESGQGNAEYSIIAALVAVLISACANLPILGKMIPSSSISPAPATISQEATQSKEPVVTTPTSDPTSASPSSPVSPTPEPTRTPSISNDTFGNVSPSPTASADPSWEMMSGRFNAKFEVTYPGGAFAKTIITLTDSQTGEIKTVAIDGAIKYSDFNQNGNRLVVITSDGSSSSSFVVRNFLWVINPLDGTAKKAISYQEKYSPFTVIKGFVLSSDGKHAVAYTSKQLLVVRLLDGTKIGDSSVTVGYASNLDNIETVFIEKKSGKELIFVRAKVSDRDIEAGFELGLEGNLKALGVTNGNQQVAVAFTPEGVVSAYKEHNRDTNKISMVLKNHDKNTETKVLLMDWLGYEDVDHFAFSPDGKHVWLKRYFTHGTIIRKQLWTLEAFDFKGNRVARFNSDANGSQIFSIDRAWVTNNSVMIDYKPAIPTQEKWGTNYPAADTYKAGEPASVEIPLTEVTATNQLLGSAFPDFYRPVVSGVRDFLAGLTGDLPAMAAEEVSKTANKINAQSDEIVSPDGKKRVNIQTVNQGKEHYLIVRDQLSGDMIKKKRLSVDAKQAKVISKSFTADGQHIMVLYEYTDPRVGAGHGKFKLNNFYLYDMEGEAIFKFGVDGQRGPWNNVDIESVVLDKDTVTLKYRPLNVDFDGFLGSMVKIRFSDIEEMTFSYRDLSEASASLDVTPLPSHSVLITNPVLSENKEAVFLNFIFPSFAISGAGLISAIVFIPIAISSKDPVIFWLPGILWLTGMVSPVAGLFAPSIDITPQQDITLPQAPSSQSKPRDSEVTSPASPATASASPKPELSLDKKKSSNINLHKSLAILAGVGSVLGDSLKNFISHAMNTDASASAVLQPLQTAPAGFGAILLPVLGIVVPLVVGFIAYTWLTTPSLKVTKTLANVNEQLDNLSRTLPYMTVEERDHALEPLAKDLKAIYSDKTIKRNFGNKEAIAESFGLAKSLGVDIADELGNHLRAKNVNVSDISIDRLFPEVRSNYLQDWIEFKRMEVSVDKTEFLQGLRDKLGLEKKKELGYQRFINAYSYGYAKGAVVQVPKERRVKVGNQSPNLGHGVRWIDVQDIHLAFVKQDVQDSLEQIEKEGLRGLLLIGKTQEELLKVLDEKHGVILTQAMKNGKIRLLGKENVKNGIALDTIYRTTMKWGWKGVTVDFLTNDLNRLNESFAYANMIQTVLMTASGIKIVQGLVNDVSERALEHQVLVINQ